MKIAVIGSGGREHALAWKFAQDLGIENVFTLPGNGGIPNSVPIDITDFEAIEAFCIQAEISLIFVGPEQPLSAGIVDFFRERNLHIFGPDKISANLEGSKIYAKNFMTEYGVATAPYVAFEKTEDAYEYIREKSGNCVIKFDGLAAGKGVFVCNDEEEAFEALKELENQYGSTVNFLIEEKINGDEISIIGFTDGKNIKLLHSSQDHKQLLAGDTGPNTGGMGAYSPIPGISKGLMQRIENMIITPTIKGIFSEKMNFKGMIYFGIMVKDGNPYLLEYNTRFGDPETEVLLPALKNNLAEVVFACLNGALSTVELEFEHSYFADVVLASGGYPKSYEKGFEIKGLDKLKSDTLVFHAATTLINNLPHSSGGRVLNVVCKGNTLEDALKKVYEEVEKISFENMYFRHDIGRRTNMHF